MSIAIRAMEFAREVHKDQLRKYTGNPYSDHLAEVAGIAATAYWWIKDTCTTTYNEFIATAWLHDCVEDQGITWNQLYVHFGQTVADGVQWLSDMETGNRATRKALSRVRLQQAPGWVQSIKVADLISNTSSIVKHDPKFAAVYLEEKRLLLDVLTKADYNLVKIARNQLKEKA